MPATVAASSAGQKNRLATVSVDGEAVNALGEKDFLSDNLVLEVLSAVMSLCSHEPLPGFVVDMIVISS